MDRPRISVAMCTYNGEKYLLEQLESIAAQTILPAELVICDDGSKDRTVKIIQDFTTKAPFPVHLYVNSENLGVARNFFKAIKLCQEEWVMLCDQDDVWLKERMAIFGDAIQAHDQAKVILSDAILVDAKLKLMNQTLFKSYRLSNKECRWIHNGMAHRVLVRHVFATGAGMVVRRTFVRTILEPSGGFLHDEWLAWFASPYLSVLAKPTFYYRQHSNQMTGVDGRLMAQAKKISNPDPRAVITIDQGLNRYQTLILQMNISPEKSNIETNAALKRKIDFLLKRRGLPLPKFMRFANILSYEHIINYWRYGSGLRTLIKDIVGIDRL